MRRQALILLRLLAFGAGAVGAWVAHSPPPAPSRTPAPRPHQTPRQPAAATADPARNYRFERRIEASSGSESLVELTLRGTLQATGARGISPSELLIRLEAPELPAIPWIRLQLSPALEITRTELSASRRDAPQLARFAADLASQFLFFSKQDLQGSYEARFRAIDARTTEKTKLRYALKPYSDARIERSWHRLTRDDQDEPREIRGEERISLGERGMTIESTSRYVFTRAPAMDSGTDPASGSLSWTETPVPSFDPGVVSREQAATAALRGVPSLEALLAALRSRPLRSAEERIGLFRKLVKRINAEDAAASQLRRAMGDLRDRPEELSILIGALATTSRPEGEAILLETLRDRAFPTGTRALVLRSWITTETPLSREGLALLASLASGPPASEETRSALLALGAQASRMSDPARREELERFLLSRLEQASDPLQKALVLDSIGNSGSLRLYPRVRDHLSDPDEHLRARAYLALRRMPGPEIQGVIEAGRNDPSGEVRRSVRMALNLRAPAGD